VVLTSKGSLNVQCNVTVDFHNAFMFTSNCIEELVLNGHGLLTFQLLKKTCSEIVGINFFHLLNWLTFYKLNYA